MNKREEVETRIDVIKDIINSVENLRDDYEIRADEYDCANFIPLAKRYQYRASVCEDAIKMLQSAIDTLQCELSFYPD